MAHSESRTAWECLRAYHARPGREGIDRLLAAVQPLLGRLVARRLARRRGQREVEDLVQEALLDVLRGLDRFRPRSERAFRSWLATIVQHNLHDHDRHARAAKRGGERVLRFSELPRGELLGRLIDLRPGGHEIGAGELEQRLLAALEALPEPQRLVLVLRKLEGLAFDEIAKRMGYGGPSSARSICARAVAKLRESLGRPASARRRSRPARAGRRKA